MKLLGESKKIFYITIGTISLILGTIGIFLPGLPTTPFYLLTAWLYMRSSQTLYNKVMANKYFGEIVRNFQINKAIPVKIKIISISMLWCSISLSAFVFIKIFWVKILLIAIAIGVTIHILSYKTLKKEDKELQQKTQKSNNKTLQ